MDMATDIVTWACVIAGSIMALIGAVGMIRLPDVFQRMHAAGIIDTLGVGLILGGLIFQAGWSAVTIKLVLILVFIFFTSPTATHALAQAALNGGVKPLLGKKDGEDKPSKP